jgi:transposase
MNLSHREIRVLLLHEFRLGHKAAEAANNICSTMVEDVLSTRTVQNWFNRFRNGNFELDDLPRSGRPLELDMNLLRQLIIEDPRLTLRCLAEQLGCSHTAAEKTSERISKTWRYGVWIPYELSPH